MNWKNVLYLIQVERKSGRLLRGIKATRYKENRFLANWPYWVAIIIGIAVGLPVGLGLSMANASFRVNGVFISFNALALSFFVSLPTVVLILGLVLTLLQQIQLGGIKASAQVMYWLPVTWQEHTIASIIANLMGLTLAIVLGLAAGLLAFSIFAGLFLQALLTALGMFAAAFIASATTEILRILQARFIGAVYKSSGKAAVWVRFVGSLIFFLIFYIFYFYVTSGFPTFLTSLMEVQTSVWFIPFVWPGLMIYYLVSGDFLIGIAFIGLSAFFIAGLYLLAVFFNKRFGLYEPPAITVQKSGIYAPRTGLLGKLGFSSVETAIIRKDIRAFTRRRELMTLFIFPIIFIILPLMQSLGGTRNTPVASVNSLYVVMVFLLPAFLMAMLLGNIMIGEEGKAVWRIYSSPISAKNLVKSKLFFITLLSTITLAITGSVGIFFYNPSIQFIIAAYLEGFFLILAVSSVALTIGFRGADFSESRRARMVRQEWAFISLAVCGITGAVVLAPFLPFVFSSIISSFIRGFSLGTVDLVIPVVVSGIIALVIAAIFYKVNLGSATELLRKAEI